MHCCPFGCLNDECPEAVTSNIKLLQISYILCLECCSCVKYRSDSEMSEVSDIVNFSSKL